MTDYGQNDAGKWMLRAVGGWFVWNLLPEETRQRITRFIDNAIAAAEQRRIEEERASPDGRPSGRGRRLTLVPRGERYEELALLLTPRRRVRRD